MILLTGGTGVAGREISKALQGMGVLHRSLVRDRVSCRAGDRIGLTPDLGRAHLFDADSGARLAA